MVDLGVAVAGLKLKNPVIVAAGEASMSFAQMKQCVDSGAGAVIAKSATSNQEVIDSLWLSRFAILDEKRELCRGNIPRAFSLYGRSGMMPFSDEWVETVVRSHQYASEHGSMVIGSVVSSLDLKPTVEFVKKLEDAGIPAIEIDAGCPHGKQFERTEKFILADEPDINARITQAISEAVSIPVFVKLTPLQRDLVATTEAVLDAGASAVTVHNRYLSLAVNIETAAPYILSESGIGGPWMAPITCREIAQIHKAFPELPIMGNNGVYDWLEVVQFIMSGATAVQTLSSIMLRGYSAISEMITGLERFMDRKGYKSIQDMIGLAVRNSISYQEAYKIKAKAMIDRDLCINCGICHERCWYERTRIVNGVVEVTEDCIGCRICEAVCPIPGAIVVRPADGLRGRLDF